MAHAGDTARLSLAGQGAKLLLLNAAHQAEDVEATVLVSNSRSNQTISAYHTGPYPSSKPIGALRLTGAINMG